MSSNSSIRVVSRGSARRWSQGERGSRRAVPCGGCGWRNCWLRESQGRLQPMRFICTVFLRRLVPFSAIRAQMVILHCQGSDGNFALQNHRSTNARHSSAWRVHFGQVLLCGNLSGLVLMRRAFTPQRAESVCSGARRPLASWRVDCSFRSSAALAARSCGSVPRPRYG